MLPTLQEFIDRAVKEYGCRLKNLANMPGLTDASIVRLNRPYLDRMLPSGKWVVAALPGTPLDQQLLPFHLNKLCRQLLINPADFGVTLH
jgi:hypothetical protein